MKKHRLLCLKSRTYIIMLKPKRMLIEYKTRDQDGWDVLQSEFYVAIKDNIAKDLNEET